MEHIESFIFNKSTLRTINKNKNDYIYYNEKSTFYQNKSTAETMWGFNPAKVLQNVGQGVMNMANNVGNGVQYAAKETGKGV